MVNLSNYPFVWSQRARPSEQYLSQVGDGISPFRSTKAALFLFAIPYMYNKIGFSVFVGGYKQGAKYAAFRVPSRVYLIVIKLNRRGIEKNKDMKMPVRPVDVCVLPDKIRFHPRVPVTLTVAAF